MARIFIDGFENGDSGFSLWDAINSPQLLSGSPPSGLYYLRVVNYQYVQKNVGTLSELFLGFDYQPNSGTTAYLLVFYSGATQIAYIRVNALSSIAAYGGASLLGVTSDGSVPAGSWTHLQIRYVPDPTNGVFQIKVNDVLDLDITGADTVAGTETTVTAFRLYSTHSALYNSYDNVVVDDANWPGVTKIVAIKPTGAGATTSWTPSAGSNWDCVDEVPASDADYAYINSADQIDTYAAEDLPAEADTVKCVQVQARAQKQSDATPQNIALGVRTGGADYFGSDLALTSAFKSHAQMFENNPDTTSPWTVGEVNGAEIGIKSRA